MYCSHCGRQMEDEARYCSACGTARGSLGPSSSDREVKKLIRPREGRRIAGVCAGVANYFDIDVTLVRILWILVTILPPVPGIVAYIVCWIAMPNAPEAIHPTSLAAPANSR
jgi:phage shock protein C